ncbi:hypothetical protein LSH36_471g04018 [Paralvinella palmiformis]|uniref:Anaphase-promoting complex subunit CDC26 n=1 Tax=Paralvinella palmiformis TaxID=53620 RepID=A0AAD9JB35_9ANNE|nr:hypothetical protein LSH36_471g04018 [Paralvinella palmiformis]
MLRRKPTRIELCIEDLEEWNAQKRALESQKKQPLQSKGNETLTMEGSTPDTKHMRRIIYERVGLAPASRLPPHSPR